jgi:hypothetical protein
LVNQGPDGEDRSPAGGIEDIQIPGVAGLCARVLAEQALKLGKQLHEQVFTAELSEGALLDLAVIAIGFDDADILNSIMSLRFSEKKKGVVRKTLENKPRPAAHPRVRGVFTANMG